MRPWPEVGNVHVPGPGKRLYAISHHHDSDVWFVTVGKTLTGRRPVWKGRKKNEETRPVEDPALVRAIFPANGLCWVFTDGGAAAGRRTEWENPFMAGELGRMDYFSKDGDPS
jgi:hypothetical protein